jgi:hypothetical protein
MFLRTVALIAALLAWGGTSAIAQGPVALTLQERETPTSPARWRTETIDPHKVGIVMVDTWNFHWCMTAARRCGSFSWRFNKALASARQLGMQVFWCPTDVAAQYVGTPQRERAIAVRLVPLPKSLEIPFAAIHCFESNGCMCGPGLKCPGNLGWDGMNPILDIREADLITDGTQELYALCQDRGITHLIYMGFHTNVCTTGKPIGIRAMANVGLKAILARDMTDAISGYDPRSGRHPDDGTLDVIAQLETQVPTIGMIDELKKLGRWDDAEPVDPVRITPWGTSERPYLFEDSVTVALTVPLNKGAEIHYTTDGSEPGTASPVYQKPFPLHATATIRATAFGPDGKAVCRPSSAALVRLPAKPSQPDVALTDLQPLHASCSGFHHYGSRKVPVINQSYAHTPIKLRGTTYGRGIGVYAPAQLVYAVEPRFDRFVGRAGVDEFLLLDENGRSTVIHPSVRFLVLIDGQPVAESPVMRIQHEPWRFDVPIPSGSRTISLVVNDGGNGNRDDLADWIEAGFVLKEGEAGSQSKAP